MARHHLAFHRSPRSLGARPQAIRLSDLILALLSVVLLGGFAMAAAIVLTFGSIG